MRVPRLSESPDWTAVLPVLIVTAPLTGMAFHFDERRTVYRHAADGRDNPLDAAAYSYDTVEFFLDLGNFRPLGRLIDSLTGGFIFEVGEATGTAPHVVSGVLRLIVVSLLALVAVRVVAALTASTTGGREPAVMLYPMVLGTTLVANGRSGPLVYLPTLFIGSAVLVLAICLAVARDRDMSKRPLRAVELLLMAALGAAAAMFHDLAYIAPPLAAVFLGARALAIGLSLRSAAATAAFARWAALSAGFLAVFVPVRLDIAGRCRQHACYAASELSLSADVAGLAATRLISGFPVSGWSLVSDLVGRYGPDFNFVNLLANSFLMLLALAVAAVTVAVAVRARRTAGTDANTVGTASTAEAGASRGGLHTRAAASDLRRRLRIGAALGLFGAATAGLPAVMVSLSRYIQESRIDYGWRDTVLVQVGWSLMISSVVVILLAAVRTCIGRGAHRSALTATVALVGVGLSLTLLANARLAQIDRTTPLSAITAQIATATTSYDSTEEGNALRCALIDAYSQHRPENSWVAAPGMLEDLDELMTGLYGQPFCDPGRLQAYRAG